MKKKPQDKERNPVRFFCDKCGYEVKQDATACPGCGRSFSSVKCPACGFVGQVALFTEGCPVCGYSSGGAGAAKSAPLPSKAQQPGGQGGAASDPAAGKPLLFTSLPLWIYIITGLSLVISAAALFFTLR